MAFYAVILFFRIINFQTTFYFPCKKLQKTLTFYKKCIMRALLIFIIIFKVTLFICKVHHFKTKLVELINAVIEDVKGAKPLVEIRIIKNCDRQVAIFTESLFQLNGI